MKNIPKLLSTCKHPLVIAVGGGNDSVSALLMLAQFQESFLFNPVDVTMVAMLPDVLEYTEVERTSFTGVVKITDKSNREVQGVPMNKFPEQVLVKNLHKVPQFKIKDVFGIHMSNGSVGVLKSFQQMLNTGAYDLVIALDVGGDFIAVDANKEVLSPMMDGYVLYALKHLVTDVPMMCGVFGLGTDGESTSEMLYAALEKPDEVLVGQFDPEVVEKSIQFYREVVEPVRYSRTADFTIKGICGERIPGPVEYRARFHVTTAKDEKAKVYYGNFQHQLDESFTGKYYLFEDLRGVNNRFAVKVKNGLEWFLKIQSEGYRFNHELNGQAYMDLYKAVGADGSRKVSLLFGTPSAKFEPVDQRLILCDILAAVENGVYDGAIVWSEVLDEIEYVRVSNVRLNDSLSLVMNADAAIHFGMIMAKNLP